MDLVISHKHLLKKVNNNFIEGILKIFHFFKKEHSAIEESNNKNLEFFILKKEFNYQFIRHCYERGRLNDGSYPGLLHNII
jgi:hypothetical protein